MIVANLVWIQSAFIPLTSTWQATNLESIENFYVVLLSFDEFSCAVTLDTGGLPSMNSQMQRQKTKVYNILIGCRWLSFKDLVAFLLYFL